MRYLYFIGLVGLAALVMAVGACTANKITREYRVTLIAEQGSTIIFPVDLLTDIDKKAEADTTQTPEIKVQGKGLMK